VAARWRRGGGHPRGATGGLTASPGLVSLRRRRPLDARAGDGMQGAPAGRCVRKRGKRMHDVPPADT
jgi:hypothetical protein